MPDEEPIAARLDEKFIELMIVKLAGQSRTGAPKASSTPKQGAGPNSELLQDTEFEAMVMGKGDETSKAISLDDDDVDEAEETSADAVDTEAPPERSAAEPTSKRRPPPNGPKRESVQLEVVEPKHRERVYRLRGRPVVIGRSQEADISLKDTKASRRHLRIELVEDRIMAEDLGSQNGTRVNDRLIRSRELMSGDVITIGRTEIRVQRIAE